MASLFYPPIQSCCALQPWWINHLQKGMVLLFVPQKPQFKRILWYAVSTWWAKWAMNASKHLTDSHQTNPPSALVQAPCAASITGNHSAYSHFLTEWPPKRLSPPWKKAFVFRQKMKSLCICYLKLSYMDYKMLCQMMRHNFVSPFHNLESQAGFACPWYTLEILTENQAELYTQPPGEDRNVKAIPAWLRGSMFKKTDSHLFLIFYSTLSPFNSTLMPQ